MDSLDLYRVLHPVPDRAEADALLERLLAWVGAFAVPERIYIRADLDAWALRNGYEKRDSEPLCALLREAYAVLPHNQGGDGPDALTTRINDAIVARRAL